jgi:TRAP-type C4-dicarboxylate transport system substrate-binding protein
MKPINIKWVLAHEPIDLFIRAAEKFKEVLDERAPGQFDVEIQLLSEYCEKHNDGEAIIKHDLMEHVADGRIEMSQMYTYTLSKICPDLDVFDLPFLFRDHDHADRIFEGPIGQNMLSTYSRPDSKIQGLAFTYSGGYKQMLLKDNIETLAEFEGHNMRVSPSSVSADSMASLGATPVKIDVEQMAEAMADGIIDGGESSWPRLYSLGIAEHTKTVIDTNHSLLLTNIIVNTNFLNSLTPEQRQIVKDAAMEAGRHEREISVGEVEPLTNRAIADGIKVIRMSDSEREHFRSATENMYSKWDSHFSPGLVDLIKKA